MRAEGRSRMMRYEDVKASVLLVRSINEERARMANAPKAYVITFGCQQNEADSEKLRGMLDEMGYARTDAAERADLILLNTCAIREHAELKALSVIGSFT